MKLANKPFMLGLVLAVFAMAAFGGGILKQLYASGAYSRLPRELRLSYELGLCTYSQCKARNLAKKISADTFAEKLYSVFKLLGVKDIEKKSDLYRKGIALTASKKAFTRQAAFETLARAVKYLTGTQMIDSFAYGVKNYSDYKIAQKYKEAASYLQGRYIVKGFPNGSLGKSRALTLKEALFFLYRFYEAVSADQMSKRPAESLCFVDIPIGHSVMAAIKNISRLGGFDKVILRASFDGNSVLTVSDLADIANGIFEKANVNADQIRLKTIFADCGAYCRRKHLALTLEYLADAFTSPQAKEVKLNYKDVNPTQPVYEALTKLSGLGINMGYKNRFSANEYVTRFEAVTMLDKLINSFSQERLSKLKSAEGESRLANKVDIENFIARLKAKKDKIHRILTQNQPS